MQNKLHEYVQALSGAGLSRLGESGGDPGTAPSTSNVNGNSKHSTGTRLWMKIPARAICPRSYRRRTGSSACVTQRGTRCQ